MFRPISRLSVFFLALSTAASARAGSGGAPGELFTFGAGARALGMGSAYTAAVQDVTSVYYNPSGLALLPGREVTFLRAQLFEGASYDYVAYAQNKKKRAGGWGMELIRLGVSGGDGRDANNQPSGNFDYSEMALGFAQGWRGVFHPKLSAGMKLKLLRRSLGGSSDSLIGADLGFQFGPWVDERLMLGLVAQNPFSMSQGDTDDKLGLQVRAGAAFKVIGPLSLVFDFAPDGDFRLGTEYAFGMTSIRAGLVDQALSFGGGLQFRNKYLFDLALLNHPTLGMSQRLSIGYRFGARAKGDGSKAPKMQFYAAEYLNNAVAELKKRNYLKASRDLETALGIDSKVGDGQWKVKSERLAEIVKGIELQNHPEDQESFAKDGPSAFMAYQVVQAYMDGEEERAMVLAHAASGSESRNPAYRRLLDTTARLTGSKVRKDDILPPGRLKAMKLKEAVDSVYRRRFADAADSLRAALWLDPNDALAWTRLGSAYFAMGDKIRAGAAYKKALMIDPNDAKLRDFMRSQGIE